MICLYTLHSVHKEVNGIRPYIGFALITLLLLPSGSISLLVSCFKAALKYHVIFAAFSQYITSTEIPF